MNRGFLVYFKEGIRSAKKTFKKNKVNYLKYYLWVIASFLGKILLITYPGFVLGNIKLAKQAKDNKNIDVLNALERVDKAQSYFSVLLAKCIQVLYFLGGIIVIAIITALMAALGILIGLATEDTTVQLILVIVFSAPGAITLLIYILMFFLVFAPVDYVLETNQDMCSSKALYTAATSMAVTGKLTVVMLDFISFLIAILCLAPCAAVVIYITSTSSMIITIVGYVVVFALLILFLFTMPKVFLGRDIAKVKLFEDIIKYDVEEGATDVENESEFDISKKKEKKNKKVLKGTTPEEVLVSLFDDKSIISSNVIANDKKKKKK